MSILIDMKVGALEQQIKALLVRLQALEDIANAQAIEIQALKVKLNAPRK